MCIRDSVWTEDAKGKRVPGEVIRVESRHVGEAHEMMEMTGTDGSHFFVTPTHPLVNGDLVGNIYAGPIHAGVTPRTMDVLVSGPTGAYFVQGVKLGSTLDPRHERKAA